MLPHILSENRLRTFKFWFNGGVRDGLHYQNELYYRAKQVDTAQRSHLYRLACRLADQQANIVLSATDQQYSLWVNLRNQKLAVMSLRQATQRPTDSLFSLLPLPNELADPS